MIHKIASWNIRGAHLRRKQSEIKNIIFTNSLEMIAILETKLNKELSIEASSYIAAPWKSVDNPYFLHMVEFLFSSIPWPSLFLSFLLPLNMFTYTAFTFSPMPLFILLLFMPLTIKIPDSLFMISFQNSPLRKSLGCV